MYSIDLIEAAANAELPYHLAHKKENIVNEEGQKVLGDVKKYERFIFDALEYAENPIYVHFPLTSVTGGSMRAEFIDSLIG